jgi:hypothetical protein
VAKLGRAFLVGGFGVGAFLLALLAVDRWGLPFVASSPDSDRRLTLALAAATVLAGLVVTLAGAWTNQRDPSGRRSGAAVDSVPATSTGAVRATTDRRRRALARYEIDQDISTAVLESDGWKKTLEQLYPAFPMVSFNGQDFPIWAALAHEDDPKSVEVVLGNLDSTMPHTLDRYDGIRLGYDRAGEREFTFNRENSDLTSRFQAPTFSLDRIREEGGGKYRIDAKLGTYFIRWPRRKCWNVNSSWPTRDGHIRLSV